MAPSTTCDPTDAGKLRSGLVATRGVRIRGFSLVELVIVIVIIGVIAAIAVPRVSRSADGAVEAALIADLRTLRGAIELFAAEHGGLYPSITPSTVFEDQMTTYSDYAGNTNATKSTVFIYGPYLSAIPKLGAGDGANNGKGKKTVGAVAASSTGWVYDENTGVISANTGTTMDTKLVFLSEY